MWYLILGRDAPASLPARMAARPAHLERLRVMHDAGRVLLAGPLPALDTDDPGPAGFVGSLMVLEFADLAEARAWVDADPYLAAGVFSSVEVLPFKRVLP